jgi:hypothetical protein
MLVYSYRDMNFYIILNLILLLFKIINIKCHNNNSNRTKLLASELNLIANQINEIPATSFRVDFKIKEHKCRRIIKIYWHVSNSTEVSSKNYLSQFDSKIFGYQIVIEEQKQQQQQKNKIYTSKFIDFTRHKFKLVNLLEDDRASYRICLVIFVDAIETIAFEKKCTDYKMNRKNQSLCSNENTTLTTLILPSTTKILKTQTTTTTTTTSSTTSRRMPIIQLNDQFEIIKKKNKTFNFLPSDYNASANIITNKNETDWNYSNNF